MLFLDTEFNGYLGELLSMGIVSDKSDDVFYEVLEVSSDVKIEPWVQQHVVPNLAKKPISEREFKVKLAFYLSCHLGEPILADWPCDFVYLMRMITYPKGIRTNGTFDMHLESGFDPNPAIPHHALSDAVALMQAYHAKIGSK